MLLCFCAKNTTKVSKTNWVRICMSIMAKTKQYCIFLCDQMIIDCKQPYLLSSWWLRHTVSWRSSSPAFFKERLERNSKRKTPPSRRYQPIVLPRTLFLMEAIAMISYLTNSNSRVYIYGYNNSHSILFIAVIYFT